MSVLITYENRDEIIVTTPEREPETIRIYFTEGGRDLEAYDREVSSEGAVCYSAVVRRD